MPVVETTEETAGAYRIDVGWGWHAVRALL